MCILHTLKATPAHNYMQDTHNKATLRQLHMALIRIVGVMNRPQRDEQLIAAAGISLDRALFPLLVLIDRFGPIGVGELADRVGRDYTTVSRQVAKLDALGLVQRQPAAHDRRISEATITAQGQRMNRAIDTARERIAQATFSTWSSKDVETAAQLMSRLADDLDPPNT